MEYPVDHDRFQQTRLSVRTHPLLAPKLLVNGEPAKRSWMKYEITDDAGTATTVKLRNGLDLQPAVVIDSGSAIKLGDKLPSYAYLFVWGPLLLALFGGAIGGLFGGLAAVCNSAIFRTELPSAAKIGASILVGFTAALAWLIGASMIHVLGALLFG